MFSIIFNVLAFVLNIYWAFCFIRIIMSWFPGNSYSSVRAFLTKATDPYLSFFRRFSFLRLGGIDFSPIISLAVLSALASFAVNMGQGKMSIMWIIYTVIQLAWSPISFLLGFFGLLIIVRLISYRAASNSMEGVLAIIDSMINPIISRIQHLIYREKVVSYQQSMITSAIVLLGIKMIVGIVLGIIF